MNIFNKAKRCYKQPEERLKEDGPCQIGFLRLTAHIAGGRGGIKNSKVKDGSVKPVGGDICAVMYAACKDVRRRGKAQPDLCLNALIWRRTQSIRLEVLELRMRIAAAVEGEAAECAPPPACSGKRRLLRRKHYILNQIVTGISSQG